MVESDSKKAASGLVTLAAAQSKLADLRGDHEEAMAWAQIVLWAKRIELGQCQ